MHRAREIAAGGLGIAVAALGFALSALFIALLLAGGVYRTECVTRSGAHVSGWELPESIPYLWDPGEGCEAHTLTRYALGKAGVMDEVQ